MRKTPSIAACRLHRVSSGRPKYQRRELVLSWRPEAAEGGASTIVLVGVEKSQRRHILQHDDDAARVVVVETAAVVETSARIDERRRARWADERVLVRRALNRLTDLRIGEPRLVTIFNPVANTFRGVSRKKRQRSRGPSPARTG